MTIDDKIFAETRINNAICLITFTTTTTTTTSFSVNDNCYNLKGRHNTNEQLLVLIVDSNEQNNSYIDNNNTNSDIINNRYKYNMKSRQTDYNGHNKAVGVVVVVPTAISVAAGDDNNNDDDVDNDSNLNKSNRKNSRNRQQIVYANNRNHNNNIASLYAHDFGVGNKIGKFRMLPTPPLATCLLLLCNLLLSSLFMLLLCLLLLLLFLLLCFSFPPMLHLVSTTTWTTHFISILSDKRVFSTLHGSRPLTKINNNNKNMKEKKKNGYEMKINRQLSFNNDHHFLNAITATEEQQEQLQNRIQSFITTTLATTKTTIRPVVICANIFSKIVNYKVSSR